jgi:hypothetical protein
MDRSRIALVGITKAFFASSIDPSYWCYGSQGDITRLQVGAIVNAANDPTKLREFISQYELVFRARPHDFDEDHVKITYAVSWLKGTAQHWYEPTLALGDDDLPDYACHWDDFEEALRTTFGEPDPVASASYKRDHLSMKDTRHVTKYNIEFNKLATMKNR